MKIVVLVKRVPDTAASIRIAQTGREIAQDVEWVMSPYDEMALEEAIRIKEAQGGEVLAVGLSPQGADSHLKLALEMGADRAIHVVENQTDRDMIGVASVLASVIKDESPDLVLAGRTAVDFDQSFVAPAIAAALDMPFLSGAVKVELGGGSVTIRREGDGGTEVLTAALPCVVTAQKGLNEPRYPSLKAKMLAKKKQIAQVNPPATVNIVELVGLEYPPQRKAGRILGEGVEAVPALVNVMRNELKLF
ncbi:MAG: electron transfer flavoprotein subunit beta/FixA family protein [Planctomycetota bacterium]